jgi:filamentous hemagglutinin
MALLRAPRSFLSRIGNGVLLCAVTQWGARAYAATQLPVPCLVNSCGTGASTFVSSGAATAVQAGKTLTVLQTSNNATLNWSSFNISADGKVVFQQPSASSIALNRIFDANPSSIFGALTANGQVYLINANGFLFGAGATVNVAGLLASSLNITDSTFSSGILAPLQSNLPALQQFTDSSGKPILNTGVITVQSGAQLAATDGGRLLLAAPTVLNGGSLSAPDGQVVLAAGQNVYLQASDQPDLRGLIVEVDGGTGAAQQLSAPTVSNQAAGQLSAARGNVTLVGLAVNQDGRISATTTVSANGSVTLQAADGLRNPGGGAPISATQGGTLTIGADSIIDVLPEYSDTTTAVAAQPQLPSLIALTGQQVLMQGGTIDAPGGTLNVLAAANPSLGVQSGDNSQARIRVDSGTNIDLAGSDTDLPMSANLVTVQLRSNEFADDPTQRNGALRGLTVVVDARADGGLGTPIADVTAAIAAVGQNISQRTETGGTVTFQSEGDVVFNPGASINVSGGATTYQGGSIQTTTLIGPGGKLVDIGSANPLLNYTGVVNPTVTQTYNSWGVQQIVPTPGLSHYESTYVQGAAAGTIQFAAPSLVLGGALKGTAVNGPYQRGPIGSAFGDAVPGGTLIIGDPAGAGGSGANGTPIDYLSPSVELTRNPTPVVVADSVALPQQTLQLPASYLTSDGFTNTQIFSNTNVTLPAGLPLQLNPGASLQVLAPHIEIDSNISVLGGSLSFESVLTVASLLANPPQLGVGVGNGVTLDVSGQWTNDSLLAGGLGTAPPFQNAGSINLQLTAPDSQLVLGNAVSLKANGGAWLNSSGSLVYGTGGAITLDASPAPDAVQFGQGTLVEAFGTGTATGGSFSLAAPRIEISQGNGSSWNTAQRVDDVNSSAQVLDIYAPLFSQYGFSSISLTATGAAESSATNDVLSVAAGTTITAQGRSLQLDPGYQTIVSGGTVAGLTHAVTLPEYSRTPVNVSLNVLREADDFLLVTAPIGNLDIQAGASILADPGASISLTGVGSIFIDGTLRAPGGTISVQIPSLASSPSNGIFDLGYQPGQGIELASQAVLDVSGTTVLTPNTQGLLIGKALPGGSVGLVAQRGTVVTQPGSSIDISGTSASLDIVNPGNAGGYLSAVVATAGGSLTVGSSESISLLGNLEAKAGTGNTGAAAAGSLEVDLTRSATAAPSLPQLPGSALQIELVDSTSGTTANAAGSDLAVLGIAQLQSSGIDSLTLRAGGLAATGNILIDTSQPLSLGRQIVFDAPSLTVANGVNSDISAPYVEIGNSQSLGASAAASAVVSGTGTLMVSAQQINVLGNFALNGLASSTLSSSGDIQLQGTTLNQTGPEVGSVVTNGNLTLNAARIYPDTYTDFTIQSLGTGATVGIGQTTASPGTPLSGGGSVSISADNVAISGTVLAPFGTINLAANNSLTLANGALVSVSGAGLDVPYGLTQENGAEWLYTTPNGTTNTITGVPTKQVSLTAPNVTVQPKATVNITGGGDLYAYEWVPGTGGTTDALAAGVVPGLYAILPAARGQAAPYDPQESGAANPTQTVYLSGGAGVAAGFYALLPARYALEPGAALVQIEPSYTSVTSGQIGALGDGTPVIAGYLSSGTTGLHTGVTGYEGFAIYPGSYAQQLAAYNISQASTYYGALAAAAGNGAVAEPADAGTFTLSITPALNNSLNLQGSVLTAAASGGRGAQVNLSAPDLEISSGSPTGAAGSIIVAGSVLQSWNASALTLGGTSSSDGTSTSIAVAANSVTVDSGVQLTADQIELVAQQSIDLKPGASLSSTSGKNGTVLTTLPVLQPVTLTDADGNPLPQGALLAVSDLNLPVVSRTVANGAAPATIDLESGATLSSGGALAFDAPGNVSVAGTVNGKGASWSLSSGSVAFVGSGTSTDSLNIDSNLLASLQQAGAVRIASEGNIDLDAPVTLGASSTAATPTLSSLTLVGTAINNQANGDSLFGAAALTLAGAGTGNSSPASAGSGNLSFVANTLTVGPGSLAVNGFAHTLAQVGGAVSTSGSGGLNVGGDLAINALEITSAPDAADALGTTLSATGNLSIGAPATLAANTTLPTLVGGNLTLSALGNIDDAGTIAVPAGLVSLNAGGNLHLAGTASINAAGSLLQAVDQSAAAPGGMVTLTAGGNISLDSGSTLSVAGTGTAPAGSATIVAAGTVNLAATLLGGASATAGGTGGSFTLDAGQLLGGLTPLASNLTAGGFTNAVNVRVQTGDLDLANGAVLSANHITLTADSGAVDIAGLLSAPSAGQRGLIDLSGGTGVTLEATGQLRADGSGSTGRGGEIDINSTCSSCAITLDSGSLVSAAGSAQMGELVLRAPALLATNDVAINPGSQGIGADVSQAGQVIVEPVMVFQTTAATVNGDLSNDVAAAANFLSSANPTIASRLTSTSATPINVQAGVELQDANASDNLTVRSLDLSPYSTQGQVISVGLRAAGSITINGTISDGYVAGPRAGLTALSNSPSGSLSFVAGADLSSANPLSVLAGSSAALTLASTENASGKSTGAPPAIVRTGTGDIDLVAAGDVNLRTGTAVYTSGTAAAAPLTVLLAGANHLVDFATGGGNVSIDAGLDVVGSPVVNANGNSSVTGWQVREGNATTPALFGTDLGAFDWNVGALGGGDVSVSAGRNVLALSAATADSLVSAAHSNSGSSTVYGAGGGLTISAGGDIGSAQVYVANGVGTLTAGGGLTPILTSSNNDPVGSAIALGDSQIAVWARQSVQIDAVYNPTYVPQSVTTGVLAGEYFTYGANSALSLSSTDGDVTFELNITNGTLGALIGQKSADSPKSGNFFALPANLSIQALQGDIDLGLGENAALFPSSTGQLVLFAGRDINATNSQGIFMSDSFPTSIPTAANPGVVEASGPLTVAGLAEFQGDIHAGDASPALITAGQDIDNLVLSIPKAAQLVAGEDIVNLQYNGQNTSPSDVTLISAGRDITYDSTTGGIVLGGQGSLDVLAGRNINLGLASGITTVGNLANPNLPSSAGADITLVAGYGTQGADLSGFVQQVIVPSVTYQAQLVSYVESLNGDSGLTFAQAEADFNGFTTVQQSALVDNVFFNELLLSGRAANSGTGVGFAQGYAAIDALFPNSRNPTASNPDPYSGNLNLTSSQIYTVSGGNISLLVPGGEIDVGLANPPSTLVQKPASQLGIVAEGAGNVDIYSAGDVNVNASRIFTLGGGNILIWSDEGSIDAGNGSKSSLSVPPPIVLISASGQITLDFAGALATGSGIRTIQTNAGTLPGNVDLDAPVGTVNAGDAGIGAAGNINIAAAHVIGVDNINFGGTATGVPSDLSSLGAALSSVSAVAGSATTSATASVAESAATKEATPLAQTALSWLDVFVTGLGEDNCKPDDIECLKRQKTATP